LILFSAQQTWGALPARLYDRFVARGQEALYGALLDEVVRAAGGRIMGRGSVHGSLGSVPNEGAEVLDVGAGPGHAAVLLARRIEGLRVVGVDSSPEMVRLAERHALLTGTTRARFEVGSAMNLPFVDGRFACVYSFASLKHWPDRARGLAEIERVLAPGGVAVIIEANRAADVSVLLRYARRWPWLPPPALVLAFRALIARGSLDDAEARALLGASHLGQSPESGVRAYPDMPLLCMIGHKPASSVTR
jgi:SAM-dependent methyltransferase